MTIRPFVQLNVEPGTLIENGADVAEVHPTVGTVNTPPDIEKLISVVKFALSSLPAILRTPPSMFIVPPL